MHFLLAYSPSSKGSQRPSPEEVRRLLEGHAQEFTFCHDWISALEFAAIQDFSAIWMDWKLIKDYYPKFHHKLRRLNPHVPLIILTDNCKIDAKICGGNDLLFSATQTKSLWEQLDRLVTHLKSYHDLLSSLPEDTRTHLRPNGFGPFIGNSQSMLEIYGQIAKVASTDFTVSILGESGSGKELMARTIHDLSPRKNHRFVSLNCAAIPENLLESELFGYERGAFTGANQAKPGKFELAHQGTFFMDEVGDMPPILQAKLLRVLEDHRVERLGGTTDKEVDIRVLTATNQNLSGLVRKGIFRPELHYRLNVIPIQLPPLSKRKEDILLLTLHFLKRMIRENPGLVRSVHWELIDEIRNLDLSGNVRELENLLVRMVFRSDGPTLGKSAVLEESGKDDASFSSNGILPLRTLEKMAVERALRQLKGNISQAASRLEISRTALYRKIKKYRLDTEEVP